MNFNTMKLISWLSAGTLLTAFNVVLDLQILSSLRMTMNAIALGE